MYICSILELKKFNQVERFSQINNFLLSVQIKTVWQKKKHPFIFSVTVLFMQSVFVYAFKNFFILYLSLESLHFRLFSHQHRTFLTTLQLARFVLTRRALLLFACVKRNKKENSLI